LRHAETRELNERAERRRFGKVQVMASETALKNLAREEFLSRQQPIDE
jgi:hypothetical protein